MSIEWEHSYYHTPGNFWGIIFRQRTIEVHDFLSTKSLCLSYEWAWPSVWEKNFATNCQSC